MAKRHSGTAFLGRLRKSMTLRKVWMNNSRLPARLAAFEDGLGRPSYLSFDADAGSIRHVG